MNILMTSGGTKVMVDRVRHLGNMSNGTFGSRIARQILLHCDYSDSLTFLTAKRAEAPFSNTVNWAKKDAHDKMSDLVYYQKFYDEHKRHYKEVEYKTFQDYQLKMTELLLGDRPDVVVLAAAVSDYTVANYTDGKIRSKDQLAIQLEPAPKIISMIKEHCPHARLIGFKLLVNETDEHLIAAAQDSCVKNGCEFVIANDLRDIEADKHRALIVDSDGLVNTIHSKDYEPEYLASIVARLILHGTQKALRGMK